jgi:hypothetical protein
MKEGVRFFAPPNAEAGPLSMQELDRGITKYAAWLDGGKGGTVHSGQAGVALASLYVAEMETDPGKREEWRAKAAVEARGLGQQRSRRDGCTFVEGQPGVWCVAGACGGAAAEQKRFMEQLCRTAEAAVSEELSDELWYGRAGLVNALLFAEDHFDAAASCREPLHEAQVQLWDRIVAQSDYSWHGTRYVGLVHGYAGIVLMLHRVAERFTASERSAREAGLTKTSDLATMLASLQLPSGNFPSSLKESRRERDEMVQLCHGAPGVAVALLELGGTFVDAAVKAGQCIWERGLLSKGVGLCHGIGGNGLVLLQLYQATGDELWLSRAMAFARFAIERCADKESPLVREPDDPWGLVNGIGGLVCLLAALKHVVQRGNVKIHLPFL